MTADLQSRGQWTSASAAQADALCPARHLRQRNLPEQPSADAESGTRVHDWLAGKDLELTVQEQDLAYDALEIETRLIGEHLGFRISDLELRGREAAGPGVTVYREKRFWLEWEKVEQFNSPLEMRGMFTRRLVRHSGQLDILVVSGNRAFLSERKSLWGDVEESPKNLQVRDQCVLAMANLPIREIVAIVNQPRITHNPVPALYTLDDAARAMEEMKARVEASNDPNAKAVPGELQCKFCRAKAVCPEFLNSSLPIAFTTQLPEPSGPFLADVIAKLPGDRLGRGLGMARLLAQAFEDETRARLARGGTVDGWHLAPGRVTEKIVNPQAVFERYSALGGDTASFMEAVTLAKGKLENALRGLTGARGAALKAEMSKLLAGATESKASQEILERV